MFGQIYGNDPQIYLLGISNLIEADSLWQDIETNLLLEIEKPLSFTHLPENTKSFYPNPFKHLLFYDLEELQGDIEFKIYNQIGQEVFYEAIHQGTGSGKSKHNLIELSHLPSGLYNIVVLKEGKLQYTKKIIKY